MWVVIEKSKENPQKHFWISGVFKNRQDAQEFGSHKNLTRELREIPAQDYPVMLMSDWVNFDYIYVTPEELAEKLLAFEKNQDEDHQYCIYYIFREDYRSTTPGEDSLGLTDHHHVDNQEIRDLVRIGLNVRSVGHLRGIYACDHCGRLNVGVLSEKGYSPPPGWQILHETEEEAYLTICSEECWRLIKEDT